MKMTEIKVLPFTCKRGEVQGHALNVAIRDAAWVSHVVLWTFDAEAGCGVEVLVPVHDWTRHMYRKWPNCGEVRAVLMKDGKRLHAKAIYAHMYGETQFKAAPILCTGVIAIHALMSGETLVEVVGAMQWAYGQRRPEDASLLLDPWKRDNDLFNERMKEAQNG